MLRVNKDPAQNLKRADNPTEVHYGCRCPRRQAAGGKPDHLLNARIKALVSA